MYCFWLWIFLLNFFLRFYWIVIYKKSAWIVILFMLHTLVCNHAQFTLCYFCSKSSCQIGWLVNWSLNWVESHQFLLILHHSLKTFTQNLTPGKLFQLHVLWKFVRYSNEQESYIFNTGGRLPLLKIYPAHHLDSPLIHNLQIPEFLQCPALSRYVFPCLCRAGSTETSGMLISILISDRMIFREQQKVLWHYLMMTATLEQVSNLNQSQICISNNLIRPLILSSFVFKDLTRPKTKPLGGAYNSDVSITGLGFCSAWQCQDIHGALWNLFLSCREMIIGVLDSLIPPHLDHLEVSIKHSQAF